MNACTFPLSIMGSVEQGDAVRLLSTLPEACIDLIVTDLPYESLEKHRAVGTTTRLKHSKASSNDWFGVFPNARFPELFAQFFRVLRKDRHLYLWCDDETSDVMKPALSEAGFHIWKRLVWDKMAMGMGYHYRASYEFILFAEKGKRKVHDLGIADILRVKRLRGPQYYPTEKPEELYCILIEQSTEPGEVVCDPFCGSGAGLAAAAKIGRRYVGFDIAASAVERSKKRLETT